MSFLDHFGRHRGQAFAFMLTDAERVHHAIGVWRGLHGRYVCAIPAEFEILVSTMKASILKVITLDTVAVWTFSFWTLGMMACL